MSDIKPTMADGVDEGYDYKDDGSFDAAFLCVFCSEDQVKFT